MDSNGGFTLPQSKTTRTIDSTALEEKGSSAYDDYPNDSQTARTAVESNQQAVLSAVKNLQEKILKLELGRKRAEEKLEKLKSESNSINQNNQKRFMPSQTEMSNQSQRFTDQLDSAQSRCHLLEQQLLYMRTMLNQADTDIKYRHGISTISKDFQTDTQNSPELKQTMQKSSLNPNLAEMKIQQLEEQLKLEQKRRQMMEKKTSQLQKAIEKNVNYRSRSSHPRKVPTCVSLKTSRIKRPASSGLPHYRLNLKNIPFIAGKATTPSHNIGANLQEVISLLKTHNPRLCALFGHQDIHSSADCPKRTLPTRTYSAPVTTLASAPKTNLIPPKSASNVISSSSSSSVRSESELSDLLLALQDEFGAMSFEQQEMVRQINQENSQTIRKELENELEQLSDKIDVKSRQIAKLNAHVEKMRKRQKEDTNTDRRTISKNPESSESGEVLVITTVKTKGHKAQPIQIGHLPHRDLQLKMFKDIKTLQTTLKKDDVIWE